MASSALHPGSGSVARLVMGIASVLVSSACDESGPRIYTARAYSAEAACLESYAPIGRVEAGELGASCAPVCLWVDGLLPESGLHVSTVCPPYPATAVPTDAVTSADCAVALELLEAEVFCDQEPASDAGGPDVAVVGETAGDAAAPSDAGQE